MARLGALAQLELDHLHLRVARVRGEGLGVEAAFGIAAAEVAGADLPDQVAAVLAVVAADRTSPVSCAKPPRAAAVQRQDGVGAQGAEAHRRDVEDAGRIGLGALGADGHAEVVRGQLRRRHRVVDPLVALRMHVALRAEGALVLVALGALVDQRALLAREGRGLVVGLEEVLADLRPHDLEQVAQMAGQRVVAKHRAPRLQPVVQPQQAQRAEDQRRHAGQAPQRPGGPAQQRRRAAGQPWRQPQRHVPVQRVHPCVHHTVSLCPAAALSGEARLSRKGKRHWRFDSRPTMRSRQPGSLRSSSSAGSVICERIE